MLTFALRRIAVCGVVAMAFNAWGDAVPASVRLADSFDAASFAEPEAVLWPGAFWLWNAPLDPEILRSQLRDMADHDLRSVCMLPMPHAFRPDTTNNSLDPDYLTPEYLDRVRIAVEEAARLKMNWWIYDEGGWPSGKALGKVTEGHPEFGQHRVSRERLPASAPYTVPQDALALIVEGAPAKTFAPGATWTPVSPDEIAYVYRDTAGGYTDLLNPEATKRFISLTHEAYQRAAGEFFGSTVRFTFTDEPNVPPVDPAKGTIPWTPGMDALYQARFGAPITDILPSLFVNPSNDMPPSDARARIAFYDLWTSRFREAYFGTIQQWCHGAGLGSGGHLNGEDVTLGAVRYGFGHALRQLRAMDVPGVDVIWRQLFPGKPNPHHFPKYASTAAHQNGTRYAFSESFCVYGNGLTPAQMKWVVDYQYVRGINLLVMGCLPLSTRDHHMTGERPHFGPVDPLWDHLRGFHAYTARLGYALSAGTPKISTALYYPVRDMWALGETAADAVDTHDQLARELLAHQCDFDLIDDDLLADPATRVEGGALLAGAMRYDTVVIGSTCWMRPESVAQLRAFAAAGGKVLCLDRAPGTDGAPGSNEGDLFTVCDIETLLGLSVPTIAVAPACADLRAAARTTPQGEVLMLFNEGAAEYCGQFSIAQANVYRLDPETGRIETLSKNGDGISIRLVGGESVLLLLSGDSREAVTFAKSADGQMTLDDILTARPVCQFVVGEHDYEKQKPDVGPAPFVKASQWKTWIGEDYSGEVDYRAEIDIPETWVGSPIALETGTIEYAATVFLDGKAMGYMLWPPRQIELPPCAAGRHELVIRVANTLANELTSERVTKLWAEKSGPGWPSPYHKRALEFERESRGGGLQGPVRLTRLGRL